MKKLAYCLCIAYSILIYSVVQAQEVISNYHQIFIPVYTQQGELDIAIREFDKNNIPYFLIVNPNTLQTSIGKVVSFYSRNPDTDTASTVGYPTWKKLQETPYVKVLWQTTGAWYMQGYVGLAHSLHPVRGFFLTVDLCPSVKPFEAEFFKQLIKLSNDSGKSTPVAISISGLWLIQHPQEFDWLIAQQNNHKLAITWVDHSFSHIYYPDLAARKNFLLFSQTNIDTEILQPEKLLLEHNQLPSVFFRFPGLVANRDLLMKLRYYGLIPLGTDAWMARDQQPKAGSIILVHGNSNEHEGIVKIMPYLADQHNQWLAIANAII